jgi:predicted amidohydrolase YtcJ
METDELTRCFLLCNTEGVDVHIHVVGDRSFRAACNAVEDARNELAATSDEWRIQVTLAHCELVDPGDERWDRMYRFNEIAESGALLTFSSDVVTSYELHRSNPLFGMQVAATRVDPEYPLSPGVYPGSARPETDARLSRELLLAGYTINGAKQLRLADKIGSLEVGKVANLCVLSADLFEVEPRAIGEIKFDAVIFEGRVVAGSL